MPNGRALDDPHYPYKLEFLAALRRAASAQLAEDSSAQLLLAGDWNVVPSDADVWDPELFRGELYASDPEREAFHAFADAGFAEVTRGATEAPYTFWDYQRLRFPKNEGMRIDFAWASPALAERVAAAHIDRNERKGQGGLGPRARRRRTRVREPLHQPRKKDGRSTLVRDSEVPRCTSRVKGTDRRLRHRRIAAGAALPEARARRERRT